MKERGWIEPIVERVVGQVLESHVAQLRTEIVRRVMEEVEAATQPDNEDAVSASSASSDLARAVSEIQAGTSQREILRALLDTSARYAARVALFVVKGSHATGWQARGFSNSEAIKDFALDENAPAIARVLGKPLQRTIDQEAASVPVADMDSRFFQQVGTPASGDARIFPLILKDKVAALVYADSGTDAPGLPNAGLPNAGLLEAGTLELLVLSTSAWLEVTHCASKRTKNRPGRTLTALAPIRRMRQSTLLLRSRRRLPQLSQPLMIPSLRIGLLSLPPMPGQLQRQRARHPARLQAKQLRLRQRKVPRSRRRP